LNISDKEVYDSIADPNNSYLGQLALRQVIKVSRATEREILGYFIENMPLLMFILLPLFALVLKFLYIRRGKLYITHLIHSLHLHSFAFFLLGLSSTIGIFAETRITGFLYIISLILITIYVYISFVKVYQQKYFITYIKFSLYNFVYFLLLVVGILIELALSLAFF